jgi:hypothetical protein
MIISDKYCITNFPLPRQNRALEKRKKKGKNTKMMNIANKGAIYSFIYLQWEGGEGGNT